MVVKDRNDDDRIVVCVQQHGNYRWNMMNGIKNMIFSNLKIIQK